MASHRYALLFLKSHQRAIVGSRVKLKNPFNTALFTRIHSGTSSRVTVESTHEELNSCISTRPNDVRKVRGHACVSRHSNKKKKEKVLGEKAAPKWKGTVVTVIANEDGAVRRSLGSCQSHLANS